AAGEGRAPEGLAAPEGALPAQPGRGDGTAARQAEAHEDQPGVPGLDALDGLGHRRGPRRPPPSLSQEPTAPAKPALEAGYSDRFLGRPWRPPAQPAKKLALLTAPWHPLHSSGKEFRLECGLP